MKIEEKEESNEEREGKKERGKERVGRNSLFKVKRRCSLRLVFFKNQYYLFLFFT